MKKTVTKEATKPEATEEVKAHIPMPPKQVENTNPNQAEEKKTSTKRPRVPKATDLGKLAPRAQKDFVSKNAVENINLMPDATAKKTSNNKDLNPSYGKVPE